MTFHSPWPADATAIYDHIVAHVVSATGPSAREQRLRRILGRSEHRWMEVVQSANSTQVDPSRHATHAPPQSTSDSAPLWTPSVHDTQVPSKQPPKRQSAEVPQDCSASIARPR